MITNPQVGDIVRVGERPDHYVIERLILIPPTSSRHRHTVKLRGLSDHKISFFSEAYLIRVSPLEALGAQSV